EPSPRHSRASENGEGAPARGPFSAFRPLKIPAVSYVRVPVVLYASRGSGRFPILRTYETRMRTRISFFSYARKEHVKGPRSSGGRGPGPLGSSRESDQPWMSPVRYSSASVG